MMSSITTSSEGYVTDNVSLTEGPNAWCRIVLNNGVVGPWCWAEKYSDSWYCANLGLCHCMGGIRYHTAFQRVVLGVATQQKVVGPKGVVEKQIGPKQM